MKTYLRSVEKPDTLSFFLVYFFSENIRLFGIFILQMYICIRVGVIKIVIVINCNLITFSKVIAFNCN